MAYIFNGVTYHDKSSWMKARWADPVWSAKQRKAIHVGFDAMTPEQKEARIQASTNSNRRAWTEERRKATSESTRQQNLRQWADPEYKAKMSVVRKEQAQRPEEKERKSEVATKLWQGESGQRMCAERRSRWENPKHKTRMMASDFNRTGKASWNKGLTKDTNPTLKAMSEKFAGRIPDYNKYRAYYEGPNGCILMRSSYEVAFAVWCDEVGRYSWVYEPHMFYVGKGIWRGTHYIPDFLLIDIGVYVETKGRMTIENAAKMEEFRKRYPDVPLSLLGREELRDAGIISRVA